MPRKLRYRISWIASECAVIPEQRGDGLRSLPRSGLLANPVGRLREAREVSRRAVDSAERADKKECAATYSALSGLREALFGNADEASRRNNLAMERWAGRDVEYCAALALAYVEDDRRLQALTDDLGRRFQDATIVKFNYLPTLRAKLALSRGNASEAIENLRVAIPYELGKAGGSNDWAALYAVYVRGEAYLAAHQGTKPPQSSRKSSTIAELCSTNPSEHSHISKLGEPTQCRATPRKPASRIRIS
jgi:hypothetical protein